MLRLCALLFLTVASPLSAKDSLGIFGQWGTFRDADPARCYAIAAAEPSKARVDFAAFATVANWPSRQVRSQVHFRLSRKVSKTPWLRLVIGGETFNLTGSSSDAWAQDAKGDAAIIAAMRAAGSMSISATDASGNRFTDRYSLEGAATAVDAAQVGCTRRGR